MKPRWKIRNATISGAEVISAAAQITDQSTPARTCRQLPQTPLPDQRQQTEAEFAFPSYERNGLLISLG
jgi:hypothetical protein